MACRRCRNASYKLRFVRKWWLLVALSSWCLVVYVLNAATQRDLLNHSLRSPSDTLPSPPPTLALTHQSNTPTAPNTPSQHLDNADTVQQDAVAIPIEPLNKSKSGASGYRHNAHAIPSRILTIEKLSNAAARFRQNALNISARVLGVKNVTNNSGRSKGITQATGNTDETLATEKLTNAAAKIKYVISPTKFLYSDDAYFKQTRTARNVSHFLTSPECSGPGTHRDDVHGLGSADTFLVVMVLSSYLDTAAAERAAIRATYGSVSVGHDWPGGKPIVASVRVVFLLGGTSDKDRQKLVEKESAQFQDIIIADFTDSYNNLTLKVLHGLSWVGHHCPQAKFVLKTDDDVFVNVPLLTLFLKNHGKRNSLYGYSYPTSLVLREGRWAVDKADYPFVRYPRYVSGTAYVLSTDAASKLVEVSHRFPLIPIEDAFITGILPQATDIQHVACTAFTHFLQKKASACDFVRDTRFISNQMYSKEKQDLWKTLQTNGHRLCS